MLKNLKPSPQETPTLQSHQAFSKGRDRAREVLQTFPKLFTCYEDTVGLVLTQHHGTHSVRKSVMHFRKLPTTHLMRQWNSAIECPPLAAILVVGAYEEAEDSDGHQA